MSIKAKAYVWDATSKGAIGVTLVHLSGSLSVFIVPAPAGNAPALGGALPGSLGALRPETADSSDLLGG